MDEFYAGSDPTAHDWRVKSENGRLTFRWVGLAGKTYSVERTQDFQSWSAVTGPIEGQDAFIEYNELTSPSRAQFYRLNVH